MNQVSQVESRRDIFFCVLEGAKCELVGIGDAESEIRFADDARQQVCGIFEPLFPLFFFFFSHDSTIIHCLVKMYCIT